MLQVTLQPKLFKIFNSKNDTHEFNNTCLTPKKEERLPTYSLRLPLKIPPQAAKSRAPLATPSMFTLIQPTSGKCQKSCIGDGTFPILVIMSNCFKIKKYEIWLVV